MSSGAGQEKDFFYYLKKVGGGSGEGWGNASYDYFQWSTEWNSTQNYSSHSFTTALVAVQWYIQGDTGPVLIPEQDKKFQNGQPPEFS